MKPLIKTLVFLTLSACMACGSSSDSGPKLDPSEYYSGKGVGPIDTVVLGKIDSALAARGKVLFSGACTACHMYDEKHVGPALKGVTNRRRPAWIMNMILNPKEMTSKDPMARQLKDLHRQQMNPEGSIDSADARALLEFLRWKDVGE